MRKENEPHYENGLMNEIIHNIIIPIECSLGDFEPRKALNFIKKAKNGDSHLSFSNLINFFSDEEYPFLTNTDSIPENILNQYRTIYAALIARSKFQIRTEKNGVQVIDFKQIRKAHQDSLKESCILEKIFESSSSLNFYEVWNGVNALLIKSNNEESNCNSGSDACEMSGVFKNFGEQVVNVDDAVRFIKDVHLLVGNRINSKIQKYLDLILFNLLNNSENDLDQTVIVAVK